MSDRKNPGRPEAQLDRQNTIEQLCRMVRRVYDTIDPNAHDPSDCFCRSGSEYRNAGHAIEFVERAVSAALKEVAGSTPAAASTVAGFDPPQGVDSRKSRHSSNPRRSDAKSDDFRRGYEQAAADLIARGDTNRHFRLAGEWLELNVDDACALRRAAAKTGGGT